MRQKVLLWLSSMRKSSTRNKSFNVIHIEQKSHVYSISELVHWQHFRENDYTNDINKCRKMYKIKRFFILLF